MLIKENAKILQRWNKYIRDLFHDNRGKKSIEKKEKQKTPKKHRA